MNDPNFATRLDTGTCITDIFRREGAAYEVAPSISHQASSRARVGVR
jgi:hypothetical protein